MQVKHSEALEKFIQENRPEDIPVDVDWVQSVIDEMNNSPVAGTRVVLNVKSNFDVYAQDDRIRWTLEISDDGKQVIYKPYYLASGNSKDIQTIVLSVMMKYGLIEGGEFKTVPVDFTERVFTMPIPEWSWAEDGDGNGWIVEPFTTVMFLSEGLSRGINLKKMAISCLRRTKNALVK